MVSSEDESGKSAGPRTTSGRLKVGHPLYLFHKALAQLLAQRARPVSVAISSDGGEGSEVRPITLLVAEASGAPGILVCP